MSSPIFEWIKQYPAANTTSSESYPQITTDADGNAYVCYVTEGTVSGGVHTGNKDIVILKVDKASNIVMLKQMSAFNTTGNDTFPSIAVDSVNNIYVAYATSGTTSGGTYIGSTYNTVVFKLNATGNLQWIKQQFDISGNISDYEIPVSLALDSQGNPYISYFIHSGEATIEPYDIAVAKFNTTDGSIIWQRQYAATSSDKNEFSPSIAVDSAGNAYVAYKAYGVISGGDVSALNGPYIAIFKLTAGGDLVWAKENDSFNSYSNDGGWNPSIAVDKNSNIYVTFWTFGTVSGGTNIGSNGDTVVFKMNTNGDVVWIKQTPDMNTNDFDGPDGVRAISLDYLGNIYVTYYTSGTVSGGVNPGSYNTVVFKLDNNGELVWIYQQPNTNATIGSFYASLSVTRYGDIYGAYYSSGSAVSGGSNIGNSNDVIVYRLSQESTNIFAARVNPFVTTQPMLVYNKETVDALVAGGSGASLPATTRVSWAPLGVPAGSLLRDLNRSTIVKVSRNNPLAAYRFQRVQLIAGADTEGVGGSPTDEDAWQTGYICTWAAGGAPPVF